MAIKIKKQNRGKLHKALGVPMGDKMPMSKLQMAKHSSNPGMRKMANFAINARKFKH